MGLLDKFDAAIRAILLHAEDQHLCFLTGVLDLDLSLPSLFHVFGVEGFPFLKTGLNTLLDSYIKWDLAIFIQHE